MPDEEHPAAGAGGGQRQGVSDAEAAVVFHQGTGGALHLHAQQAVREVIAAARVDGKFARAHFVPPPPLPRQQTGVHRVPFAHVSAVVFSQCGGVSSVRV